MVTNIRGKRNGRYGPISLKPIRKDGILVRKTIDIDIETIKRIDKIAKKDKVSFAEAVRQVIEWGLEGIGEDIYD